jgi:plasmid stabilization system protein ParE
MRYEFHPEALTEYNEAAQYYATQEPGLDLRFITAVEQAIQTILEAPTRWKLSDQDVRRHLTHVFPFGVLYTIESDYVLIVAVMHLRRRPGYWKQRIR